MKDDPARFKVLACGRRWGKTRLGALLCVEEALKGGVAWWVAPVYKISDIGWRLIEDLAKNVPDKTVRQTDREIRFPGGGLVQVRSADRPDTLRGMGLDLVVLDECAFMEERAWTEVLRPALSDRKGRAVFISTPFGINWFREAFLRGQDPDEPSWASWQMPTRTNPYIDEEEIEAARKGIPERVFRQEYLAEFLEDAGGVFQDVQGVVDSGRREPELYSVQHQYVMGVDLARVNDFTVISIFTKEGRQVYFERFNQISWEFIINRIVRMHELYAAQIIMDSTGLGDPVFEEVRRRGANIRGFTISQKSKNELIDALAMAIVNRRIRLMDIPIQTEELRAYQYVHPEGSRAIRTSAPSGMHDDTVIALALAVEGLKPRQAQKVEGFW